MGFFHLLNAEVALATFRAIFAISNDVEIAYYQEGDIALDRRPHVVFFFH